MHVRALSDSLSHSVHKNEQQAVTFGLFTFHSYLTMDTIMLLVH